MAITLYVLEHYLLYDLSFYNTKKWLYLKGNCGSKCSLFFLSFEFKITGAENQKPDKKEEKEKLWISKSDCFSVSTEFLCFSFPQQLNRDHPWSLSESQSADGGSLKDLCTSPDSDIVIPAKIEQ